MKKALMPQTHIGLTRRTWAWIRQGLARCMDNPEDRNKCLRWCKRFPDYTPVWSEILEGGHGDRVELALKTEDYFDLPPDESAWWERIIQNHPFSAIFAGERYAELLRKREAKRM